MRLTIISDTHNLAHEVVIPPTDVLIHCGDATEGKLGQLTTFLHWMALQPARYKLFVYGNHDQYVFRVHPFPELAQLAIHSGVYILSSDIMEFEGRTFYGRSWPSINDQGSGYRNIPEVDVLITHEPPYQIMDQIAHAPRRGEDPQGHLGSISLLESVQATRPRVHCFGHIHEGYGVRVRGDTTFVNAALCAPFEQMIVNEPITIEL